GEPVDGIGPRRGSAGYLDGTGKGGARADGRRPVERRNRRRTVLVLWGGREERDGDFQQTGSGPVAGRSSPCACRAAVFGAIPLIRGPSVPAGVLPSVEWRRDVAESAAKPQFATTEGHQRLTNPGVPMDRGSGLAMFELMFDT